MEKIQKKSRSKIIVQQLYAHPQNCSIFITIVLPFIFFILLELNIKLKLVRKEFPKNIQSLLNLQLSRLNHHLNSTLVVRISPTLYLLNIFYPACLKIDIIMPTPYAHVVLLLQYNLARNRLYNINAYKLQPWGYVVWYF
jgi:hypothetical protein